MPAHRIPADIKTLRQISGTTSATDIVALTNSTGATADNTVAAVGTAVTGVDGTGSNAASKADVDARLTAINGNFSDLAAKVNEILTRLGTIGIN